MRLYAGTSGFSYKEWKGPFYPEDLSPKQMLAFYAERLPTVEINNTFYRMPRSEMLAGWREQVPEGFRFVLKASQRITHRARLVDCEEPLGYLWSAAQHLGERLGPLLFQLPPFLRADVERLEAFLGILPEGCRAVFEFRHDSWQDDAVTAALREAGAALCLAETDEGEPAPLVATAGFGYLRLRKADYTDAELADWAARIAGQAWEEAFVFFKHEDAGNAPRLALRFAELFAQRSA